MAMTAGRAAKLHHISRTALLYYDEFGLVSPTQRSEAGYRLYSESDLKRLETVLAYREAGIPLKDIAGLLSGAGGTPQAVLLKRLDELNAEIIELKKRQAAVIGILQGVSLDSAIDWRKSMQEAGIVGFRADRLHSDFEEHSPRMHARFLQALGFDENDARMIREHYSDRGEPKT